MKEGEVKGGGGKGGTRYSRGGTAALVRLPRKLKILRVMRLEYLKKHIRVRARARKLGLVIAQSYRSTLKRSIQMYRLLSTRIDRHPYAARNYYFEGNGKKEREKKST